MQDGNPVVLIECKKLGTKLSSESVSQLLRYFGVTEARVGILTDGIFYRFFLISTSQMSWTRVHFSNSICLSSQIRKWRS